ncbi:MAG: trypsin-like serine protease, partial [Planctomycetota bacterium]
MAPGIELAEMEPRLVTPTGPGALQTTPGVPLDFGSLFSTELDIDGVAELFISVPGAGTFRCTGTLLDGGTQVLTAAHCIDSSNTGTLEPGTTVTVFFDTGGGTVVSSAATITLHPDYTGNLTGGNDIAMLTLASPVPTSVPQYDIYRGVNVVGLGEPRVKVGYGQSGTGVTGATTGAGTKRAGLNSYDFDARGVLSAFGGGDNPFGGPLPDAFDTLAFDFDSGSSGNDAFGQVFAGSGLDNTGFGSFEVNSAPGDSGGPTFIEANDTTLTLSGGGDLGAFIVGTEATTTLTIDRAGRNTTDYAVTVAGDAIGHGTTVETFAEADDLPDFKVLGVTSYGFGLNGLPDTSAGTDSSFGEFAVDSSATAEQVFIDSIGGAVAPAGAATRDVDVTVNTSTPGGKFVQVTLDNLAATSELPGMGSSDANDFASLTATVLDASRASFDASGVVDEVAFEFGIVALG